MRKLLSLMAGVILIYTVLGGLKAVIYTDTLQWIILLAGLSFFGLPFAYREVGGWAGLRENLPPEFFRLNNVTWVQIVNWFATIIPIWFVAMTLYQRIFACRGVKEAKRAFFIAGLLEYPIMAFLGVSLGMMARVVFPSAERLLQFLRTFERGLGSPFGIGQKHVAFGFLRLFQHRGNASLALAHRFESRPASLHRGDRGAVGFRVGSRDTFTLNNFWG